jgi:hypothetical protein
MTTPHRTHPTRTRLAALAQGQLKEAEAAPLHRHLADCPSCRAALATSAGGPERGGDAGTIPLTREPPTAHDREPAADKAGAPRRPRRKHLAALERSRERQRRQVAGRWWLAGGLGAAAVLVLAATAITLVIVNRPRDVPGRQAASLPAPGPAAPTPEKSAVTAAPPPVAAPSQPVVPAPTAPAAAIPAAAAEPGPAPAADAAKPAPAPELPPLTEQEKRWQQTFQVRLQRHGRAWCSDAKLRGKPLVGALVELEARTAVTLLPLDGTTVTALAREGPPRPVAALFFAFPNLPQSVKLAAGTHVAPFAGDIHIDEEHFRFATQPGAAGDLILLPLRLDTVKGPLYELRARQTYRVGFLFPGEADQLTAVRLLGQVLSLGQAQREDARPVAAAPERPPADPPAAKPDAPGEPEVYHYQPRVDVKVKSKNIWVLQDVDNRWRLGPLGSSGEVAASDNGRELELLPDALGSTNILVRLGRLRYTTLAGLRFTQMARLSIWDDGTVEVDQPGVWAKDQDGESYVSRRVTVAKKTAMVMVRVPATKPPDVLKTVELTDAERAERSAAGKLKVAQEALEAGDRDKARRLWSEILAMYPRTKAAAEAKKRLEE